MTAPNEQPQPSAPSSQPEYGAMANQYPAGYDPYVYGRPDAEPQPATAALSGGPSAQPQPYAGHAAPDAGNGPYDPYRQQEQYGPAQDGWRTGGERPRPFGGIDMDDPRQNPLYGHWDFYAILSLVFALILPVPVLPAVMGGVAMWRTRTFRMKGYGLALAAVIINVIYTLAVLWMTFNGLSATDLYQQMLDGMIGQGSTGDGGTSVSA